MCWNIDGSSRSGISRVDKVAGANIAARDGFQRLANKARRVVEGGLDGDLRIVQGRGIEMHLRAPRAAAKEIHRAAAADHLQRPFPGARRADGFDHGIGAAAALGQPADPVTGSDQVG